ncbi:diguanylate cyclase [Gilvimarinus sp. DA14]|uniref:GGDEF domain-containing protein n=1 Tax=Gilvimarinus sp. DA14 TaxID=2956798 RepID=UPI0020B80E8B|nr:diguanylate cyclase [Gilvimarinus sp. DA14]UTF60293.1 GGDEF domain-containing protein [Gilvimarinus sp. DA14]
MLCRLFLLVFLAALSQGGIAQPVLLSELKGQDLYSVFNKQALQYAPGADLDNPDAYQPSEHSQLSYWGGAYRIQFAAINDLGTDAIVLEPGGSIVERILLRVEADDSVSVQRQGERYANAYPFSYGFYVHWPAGEQRRLTVILQSDYLYAPMRLWVSEQENYQALSRLELAVQWLCLGAGLALSIHNLIIFFASRRAMHFYYAMFAASWVFGWAQVLQVPKEIFAWQSPSLHWPGFLLLPITSVLFYSDFLDLKHHLPRLYRASMGNGIASVLSIPIAMVWPGSGVVFASVFTAIMMALALAAGIVRLRSGFKPARYFLLAYIMLLVPNLISNLVNLGVISPPPFNVYLFGLVGTALDALLLAFAMAYTLQLINQENIRLKNNLGGIVAERTEALEKAQHELQKRNAELKSMAYTDPLTRLLNRRSFEQSLQQEAERSARQHTGFSLLMIDLDFFKKINDQFGHKVGDDCLIMVADLLRNNVRAIDVVSRLGGEEFCVLMPATDVAEARHLAHRIGEKLAATPIPECDGKRLTCSIGIAYSTDFPAGSDLLEKADSALYQAKAEGRNKVVVSAGAC